MSAFPIHCWEPNKYQFVGVQTFGCKSIFWECAYKEVQFFVEVCTHTSTFLIIRHTYTFRNTYDTLVHWSWKFPSLVFGIHICWESFWCLWFMAMQTHSQTHSFRSEWMAAFHLFCQPLKPTWWTLSWMLFHEGWLF